MARVCTICSHPDRGDIDRALALGGVNRTIANTFSVSYQALNRHYHHHLAAELVKHAEDAHVEVVRDVYAELSALHRRTMTVLAAAEKAQKIALLLVAIREARSNLELLARLEGKLKAEQTINILIDPQWLRIQALLLAELAPYPELRERIASALARLDHAGA